MKNIEYNESIDLICAVFRLASREHMRSSKKELGMEGLPQLEAWVRNLEDSLNPFLLSDIDLLVRRIPVTTWNMLKLARTPDLCPRAEDFLKRLSGLTTQEFLDDAMQSMGLEKNEEFNRDKILLRLTESSSDALVEPEQESEMIVSMLRNPGAFLEKIKSVYRAFYDGPFKDSQKLFGEIYQEKLSWHREMLETESTSYLDAISHDIYSSIFDEKAEPDLFISIYYDFDIFISGCNDLMIIGAGTDEIIKSRSNRKKADVLFTLLGDTKRLELLRLIALRPWFSSELAEYFGITPATMSYHLSKLVSAGFVKLHHGDQKRYYYTLNKASLREYFSAASDDILGAEDVSQ